MPAAARPTVAANTEAVKVEACLDSEQQAADREPTEHPGPVEHCARAWRHEVEGAEGRDREGDDRAEEEEVM
jgi:hypothetical protein